MTNNGELLKWNIVRNGSLWSNVDFEKEVISHSNIKTLQARSPRHLKAHTFMWQVFFSFIIFLAILITNWAQNFHRFVTCKCWNTPSVNTCLWQLSKVSRAFKGRCLFKHWGSDYSVQLSWLRAVFIGAMISIQFKKLWEGGEEEAWTHL